MQCRAGLAESEDHYHIFTTGYDPQVSGTAERSVGLINSLGARALASAHLGQVHWSFAARYAAQSFLCHAVQKTQRPLPFGAIVVTQVLGHPDLCLEDLSSWIRYVTYSAHQERTLMSQLSTEAVYLLGFYQEST